MTNTDALDALVQRLREIRERSEAATPGPWRVRTWGGTNQENPEPPEWTIDGPDGYGIEAHDVYPGDGRDVYFIAHAREDVPFLLDAIAALSKRCSELERQRDAVLELAAEYEPATRFRHFARKLKAIYADAPTAQPEEMK